MKRLVIIIGLLLGIGIGATVLSPTAGAVDIYGACQPGSTDTVCKASGESNVSKLIKNVIDILLMISGVIAVIMVIIGGIRYATSNGDSNSVSAAKNTILYSVIGLVIALFSYAIVQYVYTFFN